MFRAYSWSRSRPTLLVGLSLIVIIIILIIAPGYFPSQKQTEPEASLARVKKSGQIVVGIDASYPPLADIDSRGELVGYDVDLSEELARRMGMKVVFVNIDIGSIIDALQAKKIDLIVSGLSPFPEYTKEVAYSQPYFNAGQALIVPRTSGIKEVRELVSGTIGVEASSTADLEAKKLQEKVKDLAVKAYNTPDEALLELKNGRLDGVITGSVIAFETVKADESLRIAGSPLTTEPYVVASRKRDTSLLREVNRFISEMKEDGYLNQLMVKWLGAKGLIP